MLVSVLVPVRDMRAYLDEALRSLAEQTHEELEVIVVDDGSHDGSGDIARDWALRDRRFRVVHQEPRGFVAASQRACAEARGHYIAAMGADDVARPRRLEAQLAVLEEEGLDASGGGVAYFPDLSDGLRRYERWLNSLTTVEAAQRDVFVECPIGHPTLFARADAVAYRHVQWPEDYDLVLRLWAAGGRFRNVEELVLDWRDHPSRLARTDARYSLAAFSARSGSGSTGFPSSRTTRGRGAASSLGRSQAKRLVPACANSPASKGGARATTSSPWRSSIE